MVGRIQAHLEAIYGIRSELKVADYLVDEETARALGGSCRAEEELLVMEEEPGDIELALFIGSGLLARLRRYQASPAGDLVRGELASYCEAAEGVSHFLYLTRSALLDRQVSLLELEAQAEVDKFATCLLAGWPDGERWAAYLLARLFDQVRYREQLTSDERMRYQEANRLGRNYCRRLVRFVAERSLDRLLAELRYGYRLGAEAKLRYFAAP